MLLLFLFLAKKLLDLDKKKILASLLHKYEVYLWLTGEVCNNWIICVTELIIFL